MDKCEQSPLPCSSMKPTMLCVGSGPTLPSPTAAPPTRYDTLPTWYDTPSPTRYDTPPTWYDTPSPTRYDTPSPTRYDTPPTRYDTPPTRSPAISVVPMAPLLSLTDILEILQYLSLACYQLLPRNEVLLSHDACFPLLRCA